MPLGERIPGPAVAIVIRRTGTSFSAPTYFRVVGQLAPPIFEFPDDQSGEGFVGFWYELIDSGGQLLYRASGKDPLGASVEYPGERGMQRTKASVEPVNIRLLIPASLARQATRLRVFSLDLALENDLDPGEPIADLPLNITDGTLDDHR